MIRIRAVVLLVFFTALVGNVPARAEDCVSRLRTGWDGLQYEERVGKVLALQGGEIRCLFAGTAGDEPSGPEFFVDSAHRREHRVQRFLGKNSIPLFGRFEKHFFATDDGRVFGYNDSAIGRMLKSSGFFELFWPENLENNGELVFDYRHDLERAIPEAEYSRLQGTAWSAVRNNGGNLIFGGLIDVMHPLAEDLTVGQTLKQKGKSWKSQAFFVLLRERDDAGL